MDVTRFGILKEKHPRNTQTTREIVLCGAFCLFLLTVEITRFSDVP